MFKKKEYAAHFGTKYILEKFLALIVSLCDQFVWNVFFRAAAKPFSFQLFTAVSLIYSLSQMEAHQAQLSAVAVVQITDCPRHSNQANSILTLLNYVQPR